MTGQKMRGSSGIQMRGEEEEGEEVREERRGERRGDNENEMREREKGGERSEEEGVEERGNRARQPKRQRGALERESSVLSEAAVSETCQRIRDLDSLLLPRFLSLMNV